MEAIETACVMFAVGLVLSDPAEVWLWSPVDREDLT